ncbi:hypothetical protein PSR1_03367 [Anaeromyxobacter sp. PSR-1]|nr:hypothetical protein PSR1_03367 [Anaeromyxobacter sp. PSR-1]
MHLDRRDRPLEVADRHRHLGLAAPRLERPAGVLRERAVEALQRAGDGRIQVGQRRGPRPRRRLALGQAPLQLAERLGPAVRQPVHQQPARGVVVERRPRARAAVPRQQLADRDRGGARPRQPVGGGRAHVERAHARVVAERLHVDRQPLGEPARLPPERTGQVVVRQLVREERALASVDRARQHDARRAAGVAQVVALRAVRRERAVLLVGAEGDHLDARLVLGRGRAERRRAERGRDPGAQPLQPRHQGGGLRRAQVGAQHEVVAGELAPRGAAVLRAAEGARGRRARLREERGEHERNGRGGRG